MPYTLGVDLGTTFTAAAICRDGRVDMLTLGRRGASMPTVVLVDGDDVLVGDAAERRALAEPGKVAREFKRRVGDTVPIVIDGSPWSAEQLMAKVLAWVVAEATRQEAAAPDTIVVTHPATWGQYKLDVLREVARLADVPGAVMLTEPEAAAISYAATERLAPGDMIAVYDLGGGTFDGTVLRATTHGFELVGQPEGVERLGGVDFDEVVFRHVIAAVGLSADALDAEDHATVAAVGQLRAECIEAKEALSYDTRAVVPVLLPNVHTEVIITRPEFEDMVHAPLQETVRSLRRGLASAGLTPDDLKAVLLVGGSSRIPLVAQLLAQDLGRPTALDAHPKHSIAAGAALSAEPGMVATAGTNVAPASVREVRGPAPATRTRSRLPLVVGVAVVALVILGVAVLVTRKDDGKTVTTVASSRASSSAPTSVTATTIATPADLAGADPAADWALQLDASDCNIGAGCSGSSASRTFGMRVACPSGLCRVDMGITGAAVALTDDSGKYRASASAPAPLSFLCKGIKVDTQMVLQFTVDTADFDGARWVATHLTGSIHLEAPAQNGCSAANLDYVLAGTHQ